MPNLLTSESRQRASVTRRHNRSSRIANLWKRIGSIERKVAEGSLSPASLQHAVFFEDLGFSRATYFRYVKEDKDLGNAIKRLLPETDSSSEPLSGASDNRTVEAPLEHPDGLMPALVTSLKNQVAACKVLISAFEIREAADKKELEGKSFNLKQSRSQVRALAKRLNIAESFLRNLGVDLQAVYANSEEEVVDEKAHLASRAGPIAGHPRKRHLAIVEQPEE